MGIPISTDLGIHKPDILPLSFMMNKIGHLFICLLATVTPYKRLISDPFWTCLFATLMLWIYEENEPFFDKLFIFFILI